MFFSTWKRCASWFWEGSTERELQIIDMVIFWANWVFGNCWKSVKSINFWFFWYIPDGPKKLKKLKICETIENFGSEPCAWPLGYGRWLESSTPQVLALRRALRGCFFGKKGIPQNNNAYLVKQWHVFVHFCYFGQCWHKFIMYYVQ